MIHLIGGPPRVGKSTLALMLLERAGLPQVPTDALVSMLQHAAPEYGVRHGDHPDKAVPAQPFLLAFLTAIDESLHPDDPADGYAVEGDVITPETATALTAAGIPFTAAFLGNTALTADLLRAAPDDWLKGEPDAAYERTAAWIRDRSTALRTTCERTGHIYVDTGRNHEEALEFAYDSLTRHS
ncbi:hypothetical protein ACIBCM_19960 [Streptomyces sp. NPDC051018]|uniref:hypothetical protein n=1 Tax=Streptomyces sp. NPDC051018 TaxID=3365639 RepID=UPI0037B2DBCD